MPTGQTDTGVTEAPRVLQGKSCLFTLPGGLVDAVLRYCATSEALRLTSACDALRRRLLLVVGGRDELKSVLDPPREDPSRWYLHEVNEDFLSLFSGVLRRYWDECAGQSVFACVSRRRALVRLAAEFMNFAGSGDRPRRVQTGLVDRQADLGLVGIDWLSILVAAQRRGLVGRGRLSAKGALVCAAQEVNLLPLGADEDMDLMQGTWNCFSAAHGELTVVLALEEGVLAMQHRAFACGQYSCCDGRVGIYQRDGDFAGGYSRTTMAGDAFRSVATPVTFTVAPSIEALREKLGSQRCWMLGLGAADETCDAALKDGLSFIRWVREGDAVVVDRVGRDVGHMPRPSVASILRRASRPVQIWPA